MSTAQLRPSRAWMLGLTLLLALSGKARAETYTFAGGHTSVSFTWSHAGLSRHSGRIVGADGTLEFDPASPETAQVDVRLKPADISTGVGALDRLLRSPDFFDVAANPAIRFRSTRVTVTGERTGEVAGELSLGSVTKPITLAVKWNFTGEHPLGLVNPSFAGKFVAGFSATARLLRSEWGLGRGAPLISDEVELAIEAEVVRR
ncbi:MAG: YceI family protein [Hyphomicrobiaceae bacterium]|nr:YceI family protein [Hyphomicrobiaceae bacterium]